MTPTTARLRQRNALWQHLRGETPGTPTFERALRALAEQTGWARVRILAGLGLTERDAPEPPREQ